jgi:hypothetical protein
MIDSLDGLELEEVSIGAILRDQVRHGLSHLLLLLLLIDLSRLDKFRTIHNPVVIDSNSPDLREAQPHGGGSVVMHALDEPAGVGEQAMVLLEEVVMALQG